MDHVISADESETIDIAIKTMDWAGEITDLFRYENKDAICDSLQDYSKHISELKEEMEDAYRYLHSHSCLFQINHESTSKIHSTSHSVV